MKLTCKQMSAMATDRSEEALDSSTRLAFDEHIRSCDGCRAFVRQLDLTRQALGRLAAPEIPAALGDALVARFESLVATEGGFGATEVPRRGFSPWPALATVATAVLVVAFARQRSQEPRDWIVGAALAIAALSVSLLAGRLATGLVVAVVAAAGAAALVSGAAGALEAGTGAECLAIEILSAGAVAGAAWLGARGGLRLTGRAALAAGGLGGALAADAALQLTCRAHVSMAHLVTFHVGGVLLVAVAALVLLGPPRALARS